MRHDRCRRRVAERHAAGMLPANKTAAGFSVNLWLIVLQKAASATQQLAVYVLLGVLLGEVLRYTPVARLLERVCRQSPGSAVAFSTMLGMVSPLCTYGTVPIMLRLLRSGVPIGPLATFLAASSLMNPQLFVITWGGLGRGLAIARLLAVCVFGLGLGALLYLLPTRWTVLPELTREQERAAEHHYAGARPRHFTWPRFARDCWKTLEFVGFYVILGVLLGAAVEVFIPGRYILSWLGGSGWLSVLSASLLGVPLYACGGGTIPLVNSLLDQGMSGGAALAFLVAGPATRIAPLLALASVLRPVSVVSYVLLLIVFSTLAGLVYAAL